MKLLLAEDNLDHQQILELLLRDFAERPNITSVKTGNEFIERLYQERFDLGLLDFHLPDLKADEILDRLHDLAERPPIIVLSADDDRQRVVSALRGGGHDFITKSEAFDADHLKHRIEAVLRRAQAEERLLQQQKDESLALLAGGIAHDFNNLLVGIIGNASLLRERQDRETVAFELCGAIMAAAERMAELSRQLLAYARGGKYQPQPLDANASVLDTLTMLGARLKTRVHVQTTLTPDLWLVEADPSQLTQVWLNLFVNACEAMEGGGTLRVVTDNLMHAGAGQCDHEHASGDYVRVIITDTGKGMDLDTRKRIFDPFYSTKGKGRGLGLAAVAGIVRNHGGCIAVESAPGQGAKFTVLLPRARRELLKGRQEARPSQSHGATILFVDDEAVVRDVAVRSLRHYGYQVLVAQSGAEALSIYRRLAAQIDVVVVDMQMPDMSGAEVFSSLTEVNPEACVLLCSGYDEATAMESVTCHHQVAGFLPKPFLPEALVRAIQRALVSRS
jgi:signal transduction histidine kinase